MLFHTHKTSGFKETWEISDQHKNIKYSKWKLRRECLKYKNKPHWFSKANVLASVDII